MKRLASVACAWAVVGAAATAWAETRPLYGGEVTGSFLGEPASLDPVLAKNESEVMLASLLFDTLYRADGSGRAVPHLAAGAPEIAEDEMSVRIPLRPGAGFHDGTVMTAEDVARSLERARASASGWLLAPIEAVWPEDDAIIVELSQAAFSIERLLAAPASAVTPRGRPPSASQPVGSGPFQLGSLSRTRRRLELRAFEQHFAGRPYVDAMALRWYARGANEARSFEAGESHLSLRGEVAFAGNKPKYETGVAEGAATVLTYVGVGRREPAVADSVAFRRALSLAIGRHGLRAIGSGERVIPAVRPSPPDLGGPAIEPTHARARPEEAKQVLRRAAQRATALRALIGEGGASLEVLVDESRPEDRLVAEKVVTALFGLGLSAHITAASARELARRARRGDCVLYIGQLAAPFPSAKLQLAAALATGRRADDAARLVSGAIDLDRALEIFDARLPIVPLFHRATRVHHRADVYGLSFDPTGRARYADLFFFGDPVRGSAGDR